MFIQFIVLIIACFIGSYIAMHLANYFAEYKQNKKIKNLDRYVNSLAESIFVLEKRLNTNIDISKDTINLLVLLQYKDDPRFSFTDEILTTIDNLQTKIDKLNPEKGEKNNEKSSEA